MSTLARSLPLPPTHPSRSPLRSLIRAWLPTFLWIGVIAFESTSVFTSDHTQWWLYRVLRVLFGVKFAVHMAPFLNEYGRKVGHFIGYGVLSSLSFLGWTELLAYQRESYLARMGKLVKVVRRWHLRAAALAVLVTFCVASCDEFHQAFVPGRGSSFHDVLLDTMGGVFAQLLILLFWKSGTAPQLRLEPALETPRTGTRA